MIYGLLCCLEPNAKNDRQGKQHGIHHVQHARLLQDLNQFGKLVFAQSMSMEGAIAGMKVISTSHSHGNVPVAKSGNKIAMANIRT